MKTTAHELATRVADITATAANEAQLRHEVEKALEEACGKLSIAWTPSELDRRLGKTGGKTRFVDVAHGAVVIEYEPPQSFKGIVGRQLKHAREQAKEYAELLAHEEGRAITEYVLVTWDGASINFGRIRDSAVNWESLLPFDASAAERLLTHLLEDGIPLVYPRLLSTLVGPYSQYGTALIPAFFQAVVEADRSGHTTKTKLLYTEWKRLFGQVVGVQSDRLKGLLERQGQAHGQRYDQNYAAYLFALNTYIALLAKLVAACALPNATQNILDRSVPIMDRTASLESGDLFESAGILNMLSGDFFSWYHSDPHWSEFEANIDGLVSRLSGVSFDVRRKSADSTRDLFKGIYQTFVPSALRHALGEFYTPDWLAEHALNVLGWTTDDELLDPTCGSGTFLLEALRRRLTQNGADRHAQELLRGLHGIDLNPLAVITARGSIAVFIGRYLDPSHPVRLPVYLADAINPARRSEDGIYEHVLQTDLGERTFLVPERLIRHASFFRVFGRIRTLVDAGRTAPVISATLAKEFSEIDFSENESASLFATIQTLVDLHEREWDGIWCSIIADRFAAGALPRVSFICGNPPWVKWSHLPRDYAAFIQPQCRAMGVFSSDRWVGGIESDISTVITYQAIDRYLAPKGKLGFFITGTVFTNESSEGFRRFSLHSGETHCAVERVEDYSGLKPFDGVSNRPTLLVLRRNERTKFPVPYRVWSATGDDERRIRRFQSAASFTATASAVDLEAKPVPGDKGRRPWLVGAKADHEVFEKVFSTSKPTYIARKGVTSDRNGIFWVRVLKQLSPPAVQVENAADVGRTKGIPKRQGNVEVEHLFPLLRGRGVLPFCATPDPNLRILVPQRGMHGNPDIVLTAPLSYKFLSGFKDILEKRSSYRRFQAKAGHPFYSLWSTGPYTFSKYKVLWREMSGSQFAAAYIGPINDPLVGYKIVIPDHKLYFIAVDTEDEAAYLTAFLNARTVARSVSAYASQLSLGASVAEYLHLPKFDASVAAHAHLSELGKSVTNRSGAITADESSRIDKLVKSLLALDV